MREIEVYRSVLGRLNGAVAPGLLEAAKFGDSAALYLEWIQPWRTWPWAEERLIASVLDRLALLHRAGAGGELEQSLRDWDFEGELQRSAEDTLQLFELVVSDPQYSRLRSLRGPLRRVVSSLPTLRRALLSAGSTLIHGDAHPGNVVVRLNGRRREPVFLDWARARAGSPLEDVNCWLQSLGFWESRAHRRHDTLLRRYLSCRGASALPGTEVRDSYAAARASNALAGAMKHHLATMTNADNPEWARAQAAAYVWDWGRGIARAAASLSR